MRLLSILLAAACASAQASDYARAIALLDKGEFAAALPFLSRATAEEPSNAQTWKALGVAYAALQMYRQAEPAFARACTLEPKLADACYYQARALYALDRFEPSLQALDRTLPGGANSWKIQLARAQALEGLGRAAESEAVYRKTLALCRAADPQPGVAYARFLQRQGRGAEAIAPLESVLERFPRSAEANTHLGRALLEHGKLNEAIRHLETAVSVQPDSAQAHLLLAKAYLRDGRAAKAQPHFEAAARLEQASQGRQ